jgi:hypothetical protein
MLKARFGLRADAWNDGPAAEHLLHRELFAWVGAGRPFN